MVAPNLHDYLSTLDQTCVAMYNHFNISVLLAALRLNCETLICVVRLSCVRRLFSRRDSIFFVSWTFNTYIRLTIGNIPTMRRAAISTIRLSNLSKFLSQTFLLGLVPVDSHRKYSEISAMKFGWLEAGMVMAASMKAPSKK